MSDDQTIQVNFGKPMPIFPLPGVSLMPQQLLPLHIFEPRYRQMTQAVLDGAGQIAMAVMDVASPEMLINNPASAQASPPVRPAVCIGQIVQHERLPDGRVNLLLQGICRGRIDHEVPPEPGEDRMYRVALLRPVDLIGLSADSVEAELVEMRTWLERSLDKNPLSRLNGAQQVLEYVRNEDVPSAALLELVGYSMVDRSIHYELLAEGDVTKRAGIIRRELRSTADMLSRAMQQKPEDWPKGMSWN